jgi:hypothetical protein
MGDPVRIEGETAVKSNVPVAEAINDGAVLPERVEEALSSASTATATASKTETSDPAPAGIPTPPDQGRPPAFRSARLRLAPQNAGATTLNWPTF